uniref:Kinetochore protein SPC25 n=2 Tax=Triticum urartu TaxID=4572 RepID=A0A8R7PYF7_TRIUA
MEGDRAGGPEAADLRRDMAAARAACERRIAHGRERTAAAASAFRGAILFARSLAEHSVAHREKLNALKDQLRELEAGLAEALSTQLKKESECKLTSESISNATATNEELRGLLLDQRARRDEFANVISHQLQAIEALEANVDVMGKKNLDEAIMWYNKFLGFRVVAGEGVKFVFSKVDMQSPDDEYSFCIKVNKDEYSLIQCTPLLKDTEELVKDLNCTNDLFKFVRIMRARFQAAAIKGVHPATSLCTNTSSTPISSPPAASVDTTSEGTTNQSHSRSRSKNQDPRAKRGAPPRSTASPLTSGSVTRRSPRFAAADAGNRH